MWELTSERRPPAALQQVKLKEFALRSAKVDKHCLREFIPLWLIDYATSPTKKGGLPLVAAVWNMADTWDGVLEKLGPEREFHASSIESTKLQSIVDHLPGDQARHAVNVRCAYKYGVKKKGIPLLTLSCPFWGFCEHVDRVLDNKKPRFYGDYRKPASPIPNLKARLES